MSERQGGAGPGGSAALRHDARHEAEGRVLGLLVQLLRHSREGGEGGGAPLEGGGCGAEKRKAPGRACHEARALGPPPPEVHRPTAEDAPAQEVAAPRTPRAVVDDAQDAVDELEGRVRVARVERRLHVRILALDVRVGVLHHGPLDLDRRHHRLGGLGAQGIARVAHDSDFVAVLLIPGRQQNLDLPDGGVIAHFDHLAAAHHLNRPQEGDRAVLVIPVPRESVQLHDSLQCYGLLVARRHHIRDPGRRRLVDDHRLGSAAHSVGVGGREREGVGRPGGERAGGDDEALPIDGRGRDGGEVEVAGGHLP
mmetsp:Transcript_38492/g.121786  ORF Transcript_38492/g.121786 Transcript_38492/m.121786 type:complete len:310 (+) Transcript_38492:5018-5947(+)